MHGLYGIRVSILTLLITQLPYHFDCLLVPAPYRVSKWLNPVSYLRVANVLIFAFLRYFCAKSSSNFVRLSRVKPFCSRIWFWVATYLKKLISLYTYIGDKYIAYRVGFYEIDKFSH